MKDVKTHLKVGSICQIENRIYFFNIAFNGIFCLDIEDMTIHFVHKFSIRESNAGRLSLNGGVAYNNAIYFFPNDANAIMKYDLIKKQEQIIPFPDYDTGFVNISGIVKWKNDIYIFPHELGKGVYVFNLHSQQIKKDKELSSLFEPDFFCSGNLIIYDNKDCVLIGRYGGSTFINVNLDTKQIVFSKTLEGIKPFSMCFDGNHYWILPVESTNIYEWDMENDTLQVYTNESAEWRDRKYAGQIPYVKLIFLEDEILVLNLFLKNILRIDKNRKTIGNPIEYPKGFRLVDNRFLGWPVHAKYSIYKDKVLLYPQAGNMLLVYDKSTKHIFGWELLVSEKEVFYLYEVMKENLTGKETCIESDDFGTLDDFINIVEEDDRKSRIRENKGIGHVVWNSLKADKSE